jgi:membrane protein YdbS with pleckstrin-like domain
VDAVFRSKVDGWLVAVIVGITTVVLEFFVEDFGVNGWGADLALLIVAGVLALIAWIYATTRYTISANNLLVRAGPFSWVIPIGEITRIEPTRNPASSPALSLDRLMIHYGFGDELMVSPADKQGFMMALKKRMKAESETMLR